MPRLNRGFKKGEPFRDSTYKLIVTEGLTEVQYFTALLDYVDESDKQRFKIKVCPYKDDGRTVPKYIIGNAIDFRATFKDFRIGFDEVWVLVDKDLNNDGVLSEAAKDCKTYQFNLTLSTPCFELWLLLHISDLKTTTYNIEPYFNGKVNRKAAQHCEQEIRAVLGAYNKAKLKGAVFLPFVELAIERAKALDVRPDAKWLDTLGSRVYLILEGMGILSAN